MVVYETFYIQVVGPQGSGKSTKLAAIANNSTLTDGKVNTNIKKWDKDSVMKAINQNPNGNYPSKGRRAISGLWRVKGPDNAFHINFSNITVFDERGGKFQELIDYNFVASESQFKQLFSNELCNTQGLILTFSADSFLYGCPYFNPETCTGVKKIKCKHSTNYKNCLIDNPYTVKRMLKAVAELTVGENTPVAIAITHCGKKTKDELDKIKNILDAYLLDAYGNAQKPNYYFLDSVEALKNKKSVWAKRATLPLCDILYNLVDKVSAEKQNGFHKFVFGDFEKIKTLTKEALLTQIEYYGGDK